MDPDQAGLYPVKTPPMDSLKLDPGPETSDLENAQPSKHAAGLDYTIARPQSYVPCGLTADAEISNITWSPRLLLTDPFRSLPNQIQSLSDLLQKGAACH